MMRSLLWEDGKVQQWPATSDAPWRTVDLSTPIIRPRVEGDDGALRGPAIDAIVADRGSVTFAVTLNSGAGGAVGSVVPLTALVGALTIIQYRKDGTVEATAFPTPSVDVTGLLQAGKGKLIVDVSPYGVCQLLLRVQLFFDDPQNVPLASYMQVQVHGNVQTHTWEAERTSREAE